MHQTLKLSFNLNYFVGTQFSLNLVLALDSLVVLRYFICDHLVFFPLRYNIVETRLKTLNFRRDIFVKYLSILAIGFGHYVDECDEITACGYKCICAFALAILFFAE